MEPLPFMSTRCRECGAPLYSRLFRTWNDDGTVTGRFASGSRVCHIECDEITAVIEGVSERIGYPIDRIVIEGERKAIRRIADNILSTGKGIAGLFGRSWAGAPVALKVTLDVGRTVGHAVPEILEYKRGELLRLKLEHPYCIPLVVGDTWGAFEALHNITVEAHWEESDDAVVVELVKVKEGMVWEEPLRLQLERMATLPGDAKFDRCPRCGIPREVTETMEWDIEHGMVKNRLTGRREVTIVVESINAVLRELEQELGEEIPGMVQEIVAGYVAGTIDPDEALDLKVAGYRAALDPLRARGMGNPVEAEMRDGTLTVVIDNPFSAALLAGRVAGIYQALEGVRAAASWAVHPEGYLVVTVSPASCLLPLSRGRTEVGGPEKARKRPRSLLLPVCTQV